MSNISICSSCKGEGKVKEDVGYHSSDYIYYNCVSCGGTGRVITGSYSYSIPFNSSSSTMYKYDSQIFNLIREFEKAAKGESKEDQYKKLCKAIEEEPELFFRIEKEIGSPWSHREVITTRDFKINPDDSRNFLERLRIDFEHLTRAEKSELT